MNRSITIAAARGIISVKNRQVLAEYGGPIELTIVGRSHFYDACSKDRYQSSSKTPWKFLRIKETFLSKIKEIVPQSNVPDDLIINFDQ